MRPDAPRHRRRLMRLVPLLGIALLAYLMTRIDVRELAQHAHAIGWGLLLVIVLGGVSHVVKTWAWRITLRGEQRKVSFERTLGLRLASESIGQLGFIGMVGGETTRVSLLGSGVSIDAAISSVALDRGLFILSGAFVTIGGLAALVLVVPLSHGLRSYAAGLAFGSLCLLVGGALAMERRWPLLSGPARAAAWLPGCKRWFASKEATVKASEKQILDFYHDAPHAFWSSFALNFLTHFLQIAEVYVCLRMLGAHVTLAGALIVESLTKLVNVAGAVNPGNVGTYEAGNMAIGKLFHLTGTEGLMLALCRRVRAIFWGLVGAVCLIWLSKRRGGDSMGSDSNGTGATAPTKPADACDANSSRDTAFILARTHPQHGCDPVLASVGTLPVLLRTLLQLRQKRNIRTVVVVDALNGAKIRQRLEATGRLPLETEWLEVTPGLGLSGVLRAAGSHGGRALFLSGNCIYRPSIFQAIDEWKGDSGGIEFLSTGKPVGVFALSAEVASALASATGCSVKTEADLHGWLADTAECAAAAPLHYMEVDEQSWHAIKTAEDCVAAERKLDGWLVKPTDGVFARMNRRVSIPISRVLIKTAITPNMVSFFTLALSIGAGVLFALGGYWNCLAGAVLGVVTSILDGCDGEVARLKLQASEFGCWIDTMCDYCYYIVTFAGMVIGVVRSTGDSNFLRWGVAIFAGALMTFVIASVGRKRMSGKRPEQYLAVWQKQAENESAGLLLRLGRHAEFIVRRCFLPYFLLACAMLNLVPAILYMAAFGANVAWIVSLRSVLFFSNSRSASPVMTTSEPKAVTA